jgi:hypothetical protein
VSVVEQIERLLLKKPSSFESRTQMLVATQFPCPALALGSIAAVARLMRLNSGITSAVAAIVTASARGARGPTGANRVDRDGRSGALERGLCPQ